MVNNNKPKKAEEIKQGGPKTGDPSTRVHKYFITDNDKEGIQKQINDTTEQLRILFFENKKIQNNIKDLNVKRNQSSIKYERLL